MRENVRAIGLAVNGPQAIDRAGATQILERAYSAFSALPAAPGALRPWWEVFGVSPASVDMAAMRAGYRALARKAYPDMGGSIAMMTELNRARGEMIRHCAR